MQLPLFEETNTQYISLEDAAKELNVSRATIHNWVREGLIQKSANGLSKDSWKLFVEQHIGFSKLTSRANKLHKYRNEEVAFFVVDEQEKGQKLADDYECWLTESYRNKEGIYYTPEYIAEDMISAISKDNVESKLFLEPCCGGGNFIIAAIKLGIRPEHIYAFDTDPTAVEITKQRIFEETGYRSEQIVCTDFLQEASQIKMRFDYIFTNPPWGKKISKIDRIKYGASFGGGKSQDTCSLFFLASMRLLKESGKVGFLLPNAFFNISTFSDVRKQLLTLSIDYLIDYGKPFKGLMTKAQAVVGTKQLVLDDQLVNCRNDKGVEYQRNQSNFAQMPEKIINFTTDEKDAEVVRYLLSLPHVTLEGKAQWALGIVTGDNNRLLLDEPRENAVPIYRGKDITTSGLLKPTKYIDRELSGCQQVAPLALYHVPKKIVYRFISNKIVCCIDDKQSYVLNSANVLIPSDTFPISMELLVEVLNSNLINWLYDKIFCTTKVLRCNLEKLPIYSAFFDNSTRFNERCLLDFLNLEEQNGTYRIKR